MPAIIAIVLRFAAVLAAEFVVYYAMYRSKHGRPAVYRSRFAWVLDVLAIVSGSCVAGAAMYALLHPEIFTISIPRLLLWLFFLLGSSQAMMHVIKWGIRIKFDV